MSASRAFRPGPLGMGFLTAFLVAAVIPSALADPAKPREGRFLFAGDDDWDWASPLGAAVPCKLSKYGPMPWSALDWAEEGLKEVRGVLLGMPPMVGNYLTMEELREIRGERTTYRHQPQEPGVIAKVLAADPPPNLILLTQLSRDGGRLDEDDVRDLADFVKSGGRLLVLDDSARYPPVMDAVIEVALALAKAGAAPPVAQPIDAADIERVTRLVEALASPEFRTRENATADLLKLGMQGVELAGKLSPDDPEIAARIAQLRKKLKPVGGVITNEYRRNKHRTAAKRIRAGAAKLKAAGFPHQIDTAYADSEGGPIATLKVVLPAR